MEGYIVIDIGTGNIRAALLNDVGEMVSEKKVDMVYKNEASADALFFVPKDLFDLILKLIKEVTKNNNDFKILAITTTSQRQGIVLLDNKQEAIIGLPNIDRRGKKYEGKIPNLSTVYDITGSWAMSLFAPFKLKRIKEFNEEIWNTVNKFTSISAWVACELTNKLCCEKNQASDTLMYDIHLDKWSHNISDLFNLDKDLFPPLYESGTNIGFLCEKVKKKLGLKYDIPFVLGGSDTQLAVQSVKAQEGDVVVISGTTTPVVQVQRKIDVDKPIKYWYSKYSNDSFLVETNGGLSGLNYQKYKADILSELSYQEIEERIKEDPALKMLASFGSLLFDKELTMPSVGFHIKANQRNNIKAHDYAHALIADIAFMVKYNYDLLSQGYRHEKDYVYACGGGFQSELLPQIIADLLGKNVKVTFGYNHASVLGGVDLCKKALNQQHHNRDIYKTYFPSENNQYEDIYEEWKVYKEGLIKML